MDYIFNNATQQMSPGMGPLDAHQNVLFNGKVHNIESHLKAEYLKKYSEGTSFFVETGTYRGDTVMLAKSVEMFEKILSIELDQELFQDAAFLFNSFPDIEIIYGDSVDALVEIIRQFPDTRMTFFLDAHASGPLKGGKSGGSPLVEELKIIKTSNRNDHTIFIDDKRLLGSSEWDYVSEEHIMPLLADINPYYNIEYLDGYIREDLIAVYV